MTGYIYGLSVPEENSLLLIEYSDFKEWLTFNRPIRHTVKQSLDKVPQQSLYAYTVQIMNQLWHFTRKVLNAVYLISQYGYFCTYHF